MKIKGKEYSSLTSNRGWAQFGVLKRRTNFDLNCGGVYGGIFVILISCIKLSWSYTVVLIIILYNKFPTHISKERAISSPGEPKALFASDLGGKIL